MTYPNDILSGRTPTELHSITELWGVGLCIIIVLVISYIIYKKYLKLIIQSKIKRS